MRDAGHKFPAVPTGWYYLCRGHELRPGPVRSDLNGSAFVAFRDGTGTAHTLGARCAHMRADLSRGDVTPAGVLRCPLHAWEFAGDGHCTRIPACADDGGEIPAFARQPVFPTVELAGHVLFHNAKSPRFPMPFYDGLSPDELLPAEPFDFEVDTPWYMIGANAFDLQHFRVAHDRTLVGSPVVTTPSPFARRITADYDVTGDGWRDGLTRRLSGPRVTMSVTVWGGTLVLVTAKFARTTSYGMVFVRPVGENRTKLRTIVWVPRRRSAVGRAVLDPVDARIRRSFIRAFMTDDAVRSDGVRYNPGTLIDADREMRAYFDWLAGLDHEAVPTGDDRERGR